SGTPATMRGQALTDDEQRFLCVVLAGKPRTGAPLEEARAEVRRLGARLDALVDGSILVSLTALTTPTDQAICAARCALALRRMLEGAPIVMRVGPASLTHGSVNGDVVDGAARALEVAPTGRVAI